MPEERAEAWRLFVAVEVPATVREVVDAALAPVRDSIPARWVRPDGLHVTLAFLGDVRVDDVPGLASRAAAAARGTAPFRASLGAVGTFGRGRRPRTVWIGLAAGASDVARLADALQRELIGDVPKPWQPHVTLARDVAPRDAARLADVLAPSPGTPWTVDAAVLFRSHLGRGGSRYEEVARLPLLGRTATT